MGKKVKITGLDDLNKAFKRLAENTQGQVLQNAVRAGMLPIQNAAIEKVPVLTGNLRRSIHTEIEGSNTYVEAQCGTDVVYAAVIEFGNESGTRTAQPYLRPAFDENKDNAVKEIGEALKAQLQ